MSMIKTSRLAHRETVPSGTSVGRVRISAIEREEVGIRGSSSGRTRPIEAIAAHIPQRPSIKVYMSTAGKIEWGSSSVMSIQMEKVKTGLGKTPEP